MNQEMSHYDIVVVGMGPVGKLAAAMLARAGHSVLIADKKLETYPLPRAVAHDAEIARILQNVGLPVDRMPDAVEPYDDMYVWMNADRQILHQVDWTGVDPSGWNNTYFYNQPALEAHLEASLLAEPRVDARRGVSAHLVRQDAESVEVRLDRVDGTESTRVRARYLLGADGANSSIRTELGIAWRDLGYFFDWLVVDVIPGEDVEVTHLALQVCDPARPTTVVPGGPGRRRWEFMRLPGETVEELIAPDRIWELLRPFGVTPANSTLERGVVYTFNSCWAAEWRKGRAFLLGDAAHLMPPFAGQGLAAGFRDVINLTWKLDLVLRGLAAEDVLDSFESERLPHVTDFVDFSMSLGRIICVLDPEEARARDTAMMEALRQGLTPEPPPAPRLGGGGGLHRGDAGGVLSRQGRIVTDEQRVPTRFDDVFGAGVLLLRSPALAAQLDGALRSLRDRGVAAASFGGGGGAVHGFEDVDGTYIAWFDEWGVDAVLIRPDLYVYGTVASGASAPAVAVADLVGGFLSALTITGAPDPHVNSESNGVVA
jgi:3-(3-hydroxy-phenyl)propionate hydroxylase